MKNSKFIILILFIGLNESAFSQPYIDLFSTQYVSSPDAGVHSANKNPDKTTYYNIAFNLPFELSNKKTIYLILSPTYESWSINIGTPLTQLNQTYTVTNKYTFPSFSLPAGILFQVNKKWKLMCTIISKYNISLNGFEDRQLGGYMLNTIERNKNLNLKWGFYYNKEFFGDFFVPLVGIDWKINNRNKIFGVLPSRLIYEHQLSETVYAGGLFETITTSYPGAPETPSNQTTAVHWYRIDDNKVSLYIDYYPVKNSITSGNGPFHFQKNKELSTRLSGE